MSAVRRLRWRAGAAYAAAWRGLSALLDRAAPRSARAERAFPRLPAEPVDRRYGQSLGRPVDRVYIERFLERHAADVRGRVLEIYESSYTRRFGGERVTSAEVLDNAAQPGEATIRGDLETGEGMPDAAFDCFICTQTLCLVYDVPGAVANAHDVLKPGGVLLLTVPGICQQADAEHEEFPDFWRFTRRSVQRLLSERFGAGNVQVEAHGTVRSAAAFLYGVPGERLEPGALDPHDPDYEIVVCARAVRPG